MTIKSYVMDESASWEERYRQLEAHHVEETQALAAKCAHLEEEVTRLRGAQKSSDLGSTFCDAFFLHDTKGIPLAVQVSVAAEKGVGVSMPHFFVDAMRAGWSTEKALSVISEALIDNGEPPEYVEAVRHYCEHIRLTKKPRGTGREEANERGKTT